MKRRPCSWCGYPLGPFATIFRLHTCSYCAYRMSMGLSPRRKPPPEPPDSAPAVSPTG
jgi:hypothetical protein